MPRVARSSLALGLALAVTIVGLGAGPASAAPLPGSEAASETGFVCAGAHWGDPRPLPHRQRQERVASRIERHPRHPRFVVHRVRPTQLGVIALVSGDVEAATARLRGVAHVRSWTGHFLSDLPPGMRMYGAVTDLLTPVLQETLRRVRGVPGRVGPAYWVRGGAIVLEWKAPVPRRVRAEGGVRPDGIEVRIVPRPYSRHDVDAASDRLSSYLDDHDLDWSTISACASGQGLDLGVPGDPSDLGATRHDLEEAAGMPVRVVGDVYVSPLRATSRRR